MSGAYDIAGSFMQVIGKDRQGKNVKFTRLIYVEDPEYPTQMIVIDEKGDRGFYIWQRKEALRWVAASPANAPVDSPAPANGKD